MVIARRETPEPGLPGSAALSPPPERGIGTRSSIRTRLREGGPPEPLRVRLPVPPVATPVRPDAPTDHHGIGVRANSVRVLAGPLRRVRTRPDPRLRHGYDVIIPNPGIGQRADKVRVLGPFGPRKGRCMVHRHDPAHEDHDMTVHLDVGPEGGDPAAKDPAGPLPAPPP